MTKCSQTLSKIHRKRMKQSFMNTQERFLQLRSGTIQLLSSVSVINPIVSWVLLWTKFDSVLCILKWMGTEFKRIDTSVPLFLYIIGESIEGIVKDKQTTQIVQLGQEPSIRAFSLSSHFRLSSVSVFYWNLNHSLYLRPGVVLRMLYHSSLWCVLYVSCACSIDLVTIQWGSVYHVEAIKIDM